MEEVFLELIVPVDTGVALYRVLLRSQRAYLIVAVTAKTGDIVSGSTIDRNVEHFIGIDQIVAEVFTHKEIRSNIILRSDGQVQHRVLETVLVLSL